MSIITAWCKQSALWLVPTEQLHCAHVTTLYSADTDGIVISRSDLIKVTWSHINQSSRGCGCGCMVRDHVRVLYLVRVGWRCSTSFALFKNKIAIMNCWATLVKPRFVITVVVISGVMLAAVSLLHPNIGPALFACECQRGEGEC